MPNDIAKNLISVIQSIKNAAMNVERNPADVSLVVVSKTQPVKSIQLALDRGYSVLAKIKFKKQKKSGPISSRPIRKQRYI